MQVKGSLLAAALAAGWMLAAPLPAPSRGAETVEPSGRATANRASLDWWAFQPVARPKLPASGNARWTRNPIDNFILEKLRSEGLTPSPEADKRTLIRRVTFDLTGLPPTPEQVSAFLKNDAPDAYERLVDRLLASPDYGVRFARAWLDLARFGESDGFERDKLRPIAWRYRDWVVDALNADLPYNQFARMQLAGDLIAPGTADGVIATGFLVAGPYDEVGNGQASQTMRAVVRQDELEDTVGTVGQTFLGLTVNCARCHDHKFDPISQREYYQLAAALAAVKHGERKLPGPPAKFLEPDLDAQSDKIESQLKEIQQSARERPTFLDRDELRQLTIQLKALRDLQVRSSDTKTYACITAAPPTATKILLRGNPATEGDAVAPAGIAAVAGPPADFGLQPDAPDADARLKLANWVTDRRNPLFARVIVNRIWQAHFGTGLVETPSDFGFNGSRPTHPQLLDWLAVEMADNGWSQKHIHRLIVTSATYRQSSTPRSEAAPIDAGNRLLWRMTPRRVEAEVLRDSILSVAGELNPEMGGPGFEDFYTFTNNSTFYEFRDFPGPAFQRRTLYRTWVRSGRNPLLDVFDCPDPSTKTPRRAVTTTPLQALSLMNNSLVMRMSDALATRAEHDAGGVAEQVARVYLLALSREPTVEETREAMTFIKEHGLPAFCRVIINSSEFVVVD